MNIKITVLLAIMFFITSVTMAQESSKPKGSFDFTASIHNQWFWRGYAVGPDPILAAQASFKYGGLEIGTWNGYGLAGIWKDTDLYISYNFDCGLSIALWDVFNYSDYTASQAYAGYGDHSQAKYTNYFGDGTRHFFDLSLGYAVPKTNLNLFYATIIAGRDRNEDGSDRYSSYAKASYDFIAKNGVVVSPYMSYGFAYNSKGGGTFWQWTDKAVSNAKSSGLNEIGITVSKSIKITDNYSLKANAGVVGSPINNTITGLFGITIL